MKFVVGLVVALLIVAGVYFYITRVAGTPIGNILENPREYEGKSVTVAGEVADRTSLFFVKYFRLKDKTGEILIVTGRPLPTVGSRVRVTGKVQEAFSIGTEQLLVIVEEGSGEEQ